MKLKIIIDKLLTDVDTSKLPWNMIYNGTKISISSYFGSKLCDVIKCVHNSRDGACEIVIPSMVAKTSPNNDKCQYYSDHISKPIIKHVVKIDDGYLKDKSNYDDLKIKNVTSEYVDYPAIKIAYTFGRWKMYRMMGNSYRVFFDEKEVPKKQAFIDMLSKLEGSSFDEGKTKKRNVGPLGNTVLRLLQQQKG